MPNLCHYIAKIKGDKKNVETLLSYLESGYTYFKDNETYPWLDEKELKKYKMNFTDGDKHLYCDADKHFWRVFECDKFEEDDDGQEYYAMVEGDCAWSVHSCMFEGPSTYSDISKDDGFYHLKKQHSTTMEEATKKLNLTVEIFSSEPGIGFAEHYIVKKGDITTDDCHDYIENYDEDGYFVGFTCCIDPWDPVWEI